MIQAKYIEIEAGIRRWEDAILMGNPDDEGSIPLRKGDCWCPIIELETGLVLDWPEYIEVSVHYKICDAGQYWLLDENKNRIAKWKDYYVPDDILCPTDNGYGDYIIFEIDRDMKVVNWKKPYIDQDEWE